MKDRVECLSIEHLEGVNYIATVRWKTVQAAPFGCLLSLFLGRDAFVASDWHEGKLLLEYFPSSDRYFILRWYPSMDAVNSDWRMLDDAVEKYQALKKWTGKVKGE